MNPIAIFYHCLFYHGTPPDLRERALNIVLEQCNQLKSSGLEDAAAEIVVGINGGSESLDLARIVLPRKARLVMHGLDSKAENLTIIEIEKWLPTHKGWNVLYLHAKGCTHPKGESYGETVSDPWRRAMMDDVVGHWRRSVELLQSGYDVVCSHFMRYMGHDRSQHIAAGNFWWAKSDFLSMLPSMYKRDRIKVSGIAAAESRFEAEVWIGNGPKMPHTFEFRPNGGGGVP